MILTVTMNPSVDVSYALKTLLINDVNRVINVRKTAGGKGLNVTRGVHLAGFPVLATGILGGTTGEYIKRQLDSDKIAYDFYNVQFESRNCIAILHGSNQTEILESGPILTEAEVNGFWSHYQKLITKCQVLTISGSLPGGFDANYYSKMVSMAKNHNVKVLLDCSGNALRASLESENKPYLIKPNQEELIQLLGKQINCDDLDDLKRATNHSLLKNIPIIVISLGRNGAFVKYHQNYYKASIPSINAINPVGSGDITLGGLAIGIMKNESIDITIKRAMTMGVLNAMEAQTGFINMNHYDEYFQKIIIENIN